MGSTVERRRYRNAKARFLLDPWPSSLREPGIARPSWEQMPPAMTTCLPVRSAQPPLEVSSVGSSSNGLHQGTSSVTPALTADSAAPAGLPARVTPGQLDLQPRPEPAASGRAPLSHHHHLSAAVSLREALNVGGLPNLRLVRSAPPQSHPVGATLQPNLPTPSPGVLPSLSTPETCETPSHHPSLFAAASLRGAPNVGGLAEPKVGSVSSSGIPAAGSSLQFDLATSSPVAFPPLPAVGACKPPSHLPQSLAAASLGEVLHVGGVHAEPAIRGTFSQQQRPRQGQGPR